MTASSTTPIPLLRADSMASGACTSGSIARPRGATRRECGGAAMTSTPRAERNRDGRDADGRRLDHVAAMVADDLADVSRPRGIFPRRVGCVVGAVDSADRAAVVSAIPTVTYTRRIDEARMADA